MGQELLKTEKEPNNKCVGS